MYLELQDDGLDDFALVNVGDDVGQAHAQRARHGRLDASVVHVASVVAIGECRDAWRRASVRRADAVRSCATDA